MHTYFDSRNNKVVHKKVRKKILEIKTSTRVLTMLILMTNLWSICNYIGIDECIRHGISHQCVAFETAEKTRAKTRVRVRVGEQSKYVFFRQLITICVNYFEMRIACRSSQSVYQQNVGISHNGLVIWRVKDQLGNYLY